MLASCNQREGTPAMNERINAATTHWFLQGAIGAELILLLVMVYLLGRRSRGLRQLALKNRKRLSAVLILLLASSASYACNVCGGSSSSQALGILPASGRHFVGMQYQYRSFNSRHGSHEQNTAQTVSTEHFHTMQVWGRASISKRVQLFGFLPYHQNISTHNGDVDRAGGIGDISLLASVQLISKDDCGPQLKHNLQIGGGIKLPTGVYDKTGTATSEWAPAMQAGSGSWDVVTNANYSMRNERIGVNIDASYVLTTANAESYKYGDRFSSTALGFYTISKKNSTVLPLAGLRYEYTGRDYEHFRYRIGNDMTGGHQLFASAGVQAFHNKLGWTAMLHIPLYRDYAGGLVRSLCKAEAGIQYLF